MPLRLTGSTLQQPGPIPGSDPSALPADVLGRQALGLLARGELDAWRRLFADASERADAQRRYEAQLALIDAALRASQHCNEITATRIFAALAEETLTILEREPSEPVLLNLAGVACYELWALDAAQALFRAALRLDQTIQDARRNLSQIGERRRAMGRRRRPLHAAVPALLGRARAVAGAARPASGLTLSLCMIVRDEEQMLPRCLAAAAPAVDEIVIVDTGSNDRTIEIARSFGARVIEQEWTGSFSDARNVSFDAASSDWIVYLDADEVLEADDVDALRALTGQTWREAFYLVETSWIGQEGDGSSIVNNALRMFRNRPEYRFKDRLHEQILHTLPTYVPGRIECSPVRISHYGYLGSVRKAKEKSQRNLELLQRQAAETAPSAFLHFNLGSEYAAAGDYTAAAAELQSARSMLIDDASLKATHYAPSLLTRLVTSLRLAGRLAQARTVAAEALELFGDLTDIVLAQGRIAQALGDEPEAVALYRRCIEMGDAPAKYGAMVGAGTFLPRVALAELHLARDEAGASRELLAWCVEHHPTFLALAGLYATALLRDGVAPADALVELERLESLPAIVRFTIATAFANAGQPAAAAEQYLVGLSGAPENHAARVALAELWLTQGEWEQAAQQARRVPAADPVGGQACRIELCAVIGREGADGAAAALARAEQAGLSRAELEVFGAWAATAAGAALPDQLPLGGAPAIVVALETLLHGGDATRFQQLLPALERTPLPERERREALAQMYLAHGLLAAAAQEWMAAAAPSPDARALAGLALVAERKEMTLDARTLATGALELDHSCEAARELLARLNTADLATAA